MENAEIQKRPTLGAWVAGGNPTDGRQEDDFYATPIECTKAIVAAEREYIRKRLMWEPACGTGAISKVLISENISVISTDLIDRNYGEHGRDFLKFEDPLAFAIMTNPPFKIAEKFIRHAEKIGIDYMALLLKATFWHAAKRTKLFKTWRPARIYAMSWRPDFKDLGQPTMDCIWIVWDGKVSRTDYDILEKPA